jgi:hypothetical protein
MPEKTVAEKIKELEPEILQYINKETFNSHLNEIKKLEEIYVASAEDCSDFMVDDGMKVMSAIEELSDLTFHECYEKHFPIRKCCETHGKFYEVAQSLAKKIVEDVKKCGIKVMS